MCWEEDEMYRLIIFDVDGTFYNLDDVVVDNYNMQVDFFAAEKRLSKETVMEIFDENHILPYKSEKARSATEFFLQNGIDINIWKNYRDTHCVIQNIRRETSVSNDLLTKYAKLSKIVLLSSNTLANIRNILNWLEIDRNLFDGIFCSTSEIKGGIFSKKAMIKMILDQYGLAAGTVLAVGDRYETDIKPLVSLGGNGVLIWMPENLTQVYQDLYYGKLGKQGQSSYKFYQG